MSETIGASAGKVWTYMCQNNGACTMARIQKGTGLDATQCNQAIGWLAREGKLKIDRAKKAVEYALMT